MVIFAHITISSIAIGKKLPCPQVRYFDVVDPFDVSFDLT